MKVHYTHLEEWKRNNPDKDWRKALIKIQHIELPEKERRLWMKADWDCHSPDYQLEMLDRYARRDSNFQLRREYDSTEERTDYMLMELLEQVETRLREVHCLERSRLIDDLYKEPRKFEKFRGREHV